MHLLLKYLNLDSVDDILDFELFLYDTQKPCSGGILNEFIYSARLDNLCSTFICLNALIRSLKNLDNEKNIQNVYFCLIRQKKKLDIFSYDSP